jgi:hypothetical protein
MRPSALRLAALGTLIALSTLLAACGDAPIKPDPTAVPGQGDVVTEDRTAGPIERISVAAAVNIVMRKGDTTAVTIEGQANVIPLVTTETRDGQLIVSVPSPGYITTEPVTLTVVAPAITSVTLSADAKGSLELTADSLRVDLSGRAHLLGVGRVESLELTASSDGVVDFSSLVTASTKVAMSGGASAALVVEDVLTGQVSGGATLTLAQRPASITVEETSGGSVQVPPA